MDLNALSSLISGVGFPIVMAVILIWYIKEEQDKMRETLNELKTAITRLIDRIDNMEHYNEEKGKENEG